MDTTLDGWTVGRVAELAGVTIRTLHHYDRIGLLTPSGRSAAGYRRYDEDDLERLQQILTYRELGFTLEDIAAILEEPGVSTDHLVRQRSLLLQRIERLQDMVGAIELQMEANKMGINLTPEERFELFGNFDPDEHAAEAEERWGDTEAFKESQRRVARYGKDEWAAIKAEAEDIEAAFATALDSGAAADSPAARDAAERHRRHIDRWFYDCSHDMHRSLGAMYDADPRFRAHYEQRREGLAAYVSDAITANAARSAR